MSSQDAPPVAPELRRTPLHELHVSAGARMVPFAGYEMPVHYPAGVLAEHLHTRRAAGLFDVSHMGQLALRAHSGNAAEAALALEALVPADILALEPGRQRYTQFTNRAGGILDDLMVARMADHLLLILNAACKSADEAHLRTHLQSACAVEPLPDRALLALQGPASEAVLAGLEPSVASMRFMDARRVPLVGADCVITRSGYTGEDGFEISVPGRRAAELAQVLLHDGQAAWAGLGARDSLRLEAGLCLYGSDLDPSTTPVEAALEWSIQKSRRPGGARPGGFPGAEIVAAQLVRGCSRRRVGLRPDGRAPIRAGVELYPDAQAVQPVGIVTSGGFGPSLGAPVAMGYVRTDHAATGSALFAELRGKRVPVAVAALPFVPPHFKRG